MKKKISKKKIIFFVGLVFLLTATFSVSGYYYMVNRYSKQIIQAVDSVLEGFSAEELDNLITDESLKLALTKWQTENQSLLNSSEALYGRSSEETTSNDQNMEINNNNDFGETTDTGATESLSPTNNTDHLTEDVNPVKNDQELNSDINDSLINKISAKDAAFLLKIYRRFSAAEREELNYLYKQGGNNSIIKERVQAKLSPDEIERALDIAFKISG